jgi:16S rRNA (uracil1498-N3)-methyltransferase
MKEVRYFYAPDAQTSNLLPEEEARHALQVLRLTIGDALFLIDGKGWLYDARIAEVTGHKCVFEVVSKTKLQPTWQGHLHLAMAPTKNMERTEWFAEKATEIGFDELTLLGCAFSERRTVNVERLERILVSAMKQSHKAALPQLHDMLPFKQFVKQPFQGQKFIAHCYADAELLPNGKPFLLDAINKENDILVMVGPEGDFSVDEVKEALTAGFQPVSLGESRLRTETAALAAVHLMNIAHRK